MINDSRQALNLSYNVLNLLSEVKTTSGTLKARYSYLADGTKLRVRDNGEANGFDYTGSLTYRKSNAGLQLESANFGSGVIRVTGSTSNQQEVNYFLTDHLGSVRVIVDGNGVVKERNDYYPFGARHARGDYALRDGNRLKYNGKEEQVTGDLDFLDYGWRMYDNCLGRWFGMDKLSEEYKILSPYNYASNNPVNVVDPNGTYLDWFMNELTGDIYYNSDFRKGDESRIGKNWTWMGPNGMFDPDNTDPFLADLRVLYSSSIGFYGSVGAIRYDENGKLKLFSEALFRGDNARKFMLGQGYLLKAKTYDYHYDVITDLHPEVTGPMSITLDESRVEKIHSYQYIHKSERLAESRVLRVYRTEADKYRPIGFSPVLRQREQQWRLQQDFYTSRRGISSRTKKMIRDVIPWRFIYEEFIDKIIKKKK